MSDLISRSEVVELLYKIFDKYRMSTDKNTSIGKSFGTDVFEEIRNMPTAYSVDKVVEELEEIKGLVCCSKSCGECKYASDCFKGEQSEKVAIDEAIEIVKQGGVSDDVCEWIKYDYRTMCPKNHDVKNPYWRIPADMDKLKYCPYCGKKIKVV